MRRAVATEDGRDGGVYSWDNMGVHPSHEAGRCPGDGTVLSDTAV